jgi:cell division protein FtsZ
MANPLLQDTSIKSARGVLISITGGDALTLFEVDEAASRIRQEVDDDANLIVGATVDPALNDLVRVSVVATGINQAVNFQIVGTSAQPSVDPVLDSIVGATASVHHARPEPSALRGHPPLTDKDVAIQQPRSPVVPFPEPTEKRRAIRRPPFLERLGFTGSEAHNTPRPSGWR